MWSRSCSPSTSLAAAFWTRCTDLIPTVTFDGPSEYILRQCPPLRGWSQDRVPGRHPPATTHAVITHSISSSHVQLERGHRNDSCGWSHYHTPPLPSLPRHLPAAHAPAEHSHYVVISRDGCKLVTIRFALCCHSNATRALIANPPNSAQLGGITYHSPSYIQVRAIVWAYDRGQTHRRARMTTIHFASSTTHAKCNQFCSWN